TAASRGGSVPSRGSKPRTAPSGSRTTPSGSSDDDAIAPRVLRPVERTVGFLDHLLRLGETFRALCSADADRDLERLPLALGRLGLLRLAPRPVGSADRELRLLDRLADLFQARHDVLQSLP